MEGKNCWYVVDGYRPPAAAGQAEYEGHEAIMILNCNERDAHCYLDFFSATGRLFWELSTWRLHRGSVHSAQMTRRC